MKILAALIALSLLPAMAEARRPESQRLSCSDLKALVQQNGAMVISTGPYYLYERFVAHGQYCMSGEVTQPAYVPSLDQDSCFLGYVCRDHETAGGAFVAKRKECLEGQRGYRDEPVPGTKHKRRIHYVCQTGSWKRNWASPQQ